MRFKSELFLFILSVGALLSGCAEFHVYVDSISDPITKPSKMYVLMSARKDVDVNGLEFKEFAGYVRKALSAHGYHEAEDSAHADTAIFLNYGMGDPIDIPYSVSIPVFGQTGGGYSTYNATTYSQGKTYQTSGSVYETPTYGVVGTNQVSGVRTEYFRFMILEAIDLKEFRISQKINSLWKTTVTSQGSSGDLRTVFPVLVTAAWDYIGANTGKKINLVIYETDSRLAQIKNEREYPDTDAYMEGDLSSDETDERAYDAKQTPPNNVTQTFVYAENIGAIINRDLSIKKVIQDGLAARAGLVSGDKIVSASNGKIGSCEEFVSVISGAAGKKIPIKVQRSGSLKKINIKPEPVEADFDAQVLVKMEEMLTCGEQINLLVLSEKVTYDSNPEVYLPTMKDKDKKQSFEAAIKEQELLGKKISENVMNRINSYYLANLKWAPNFKILERTLTPTILKELKFQQTGAVSQKTSKKIGNLTGASHILLISNFVETKNMKSGAIYHLTQKLVDIERGETLAVSTQVFNWAEK